MGRKIPGKKHHGVKDPEVQRKRRDDKVKLKINSAPSKNDVQELPRKLRELMEAKQNPDFLQPHKKAPKNKNKLLDSSKYMGYEMRLPGMKRPLKPIPVFQQSEGESQKRFFNRMHQQVQGVLKRKDYEKKFDVEVHDDPETGQTMVQDRPKDDLEEEIAAKKRAKLAKKGIVVRSKEEKRKIKRLKEKEKKLKKKRRLGKILNELGDDGEDFKEFEDFQDDIKFNDIVHAPPSLKGMRKKKKMPTSENEASTSPAPVPAQKNKNSTLLLAQKFKSKIKSDKPEISLARQHMLNQERVRVIQAYRSLKSNQQKEKANDGQVKL
ncbi:coiled-coil domain-containing protein 137-like [Tigriopus californicus]|uniref:coiled-coil domain-containing protein 137-like n=1 Tax=Tigriopus californicus TaxID=6832 RepID=UPI0027D9D422|nr:coiled-coil domain-containing protein 137-like [Tigriopus californicus]|eukprot:TCALIF_07384-PA protein Name:"Similar to CCDC137 Coiled-coil domain-containing protein 137 (Homo sapiens)" AED:0.02 eAED:0.02 QI:134/1/1/1/0.83/0.57/7/1655/322